MIEGGYALALALTISLEAPIVAACHPGARLRMGLVCVVATTITHVIMHFALQPALAGSYTAWLVSGELLALIGEWAAYTIAQPAEARDPGRALLASAAANAASFGAGMLWFGA